MKEFLIGSPVWNYQPLCFNCGNIHTKKLFRRKSFGVVRVVKKKAFGWIRGVKNAPHELSLWIHHWKVLKRTCRAIVLPIKYLVSQHSRHRHLFIYFSYFQGSNISLETFCENWSKLLTCVSDVTVTVLTFVTVTSQAPPVLLGFTILISCLVLESPDPSRSLIVSL